MRKKIELKNKNNNSNKTDKLIKIEGTKFSKYNYKKLNRNNP